MRPSSGVRGLHGQVYLILLARTLHDASSILSNGLRKGFAHLLLLHSSRRLHIAQFLGLKSCAKSNQSSKYRPLYFLGVDRANAIGR